MYVNVKPANAETEKRRRRGRRFSVLVQYEKNKIRFLAIVLIKFY